ncbi:Dam family site-specific DNA-(adenine-N6)-methyltransferase [Thorsellia kenyensis]|uniref:Site-specific DNA-methyltransferase (adenine-specific) n=1 Tax=Thorsellia kenyensis TaxID=1549888 RepID=A0ABV6CCL8_9GAMM
MGKKVPLREKMLRAKVNDKQRPFLKWAGGKYKVLDFLTPHFPSSDVFVEPFIGAGSVFLNTHYEHYILNDINSDLINLYKIIQNEAKAYIKDAEALFRPANNNPDTFYEFREKFNLSKDTYERAVIFLYLNKFGFNGLCRYNKKGIFNVPFGSYKKVTFNKEKILYFSKKAQNATFYNYPFEQIFDLAPNNSIIYCDPPYAPLTEGLSFTSYHTDDFSIESQRKLIELAKKNSLQKKSTVLISNHDTPQTREWYDDATLYSHKVRRLINSQGKRPEVKEILAIYYPN